ncbi:MAG: ATP-binding protein, partial [Bacteriovoracia bacterium]
FYGAVFIESHIFLSEVISRLHQRFDFTEVFSRVKIPYRRQDFERQEILVMIFIIFFMVTLQIVSVVSHYEETPARLATEVGTVGLIAIALFCRIWYLRRQFFVGGLEHLFQQLAHVGYKQPPPTLAMHTSPLLAQFETAYNQLVRRLATSERELSTMVSRETDKGRMLAVGEMSALIAHNLSGPLHAAKFCVAELIADPEHEKKDAYLERMRGNMDRATELLTSLMASLKNPGDDLGYASFETAHHHVVTLLALQFKKSDFMQVRFPLDPALHSVRVSMPQIDLIHILDNLYRNSIEDFLRHRASLRLAECTIEVSLVAESADAVEISIRDYGSGLTPERFEQLTNSQARIGLGLRLTRRLVELAGGTLEAMDPTGLPGSHFNLRLPRAAAEKPGMRVETPTTSTRLEEFV